MARTGDAPLAGYLVSSARLMKERPFGGTVQIESAPDQGTSLTVHIPLGAPELDKFERQSGASFRKELKRALYGKDLAPSPLKQQRLNEEALRLAQDLDMLEKFFPIGFARSRAQCVDGKK